jgi:hypothetical protein
VWNSSTQLWGLYIWGSCYLEKHYCPRFQVPPGFPNAGIPTPFMHSLNGWSLMNCWKLELSKFFFTFLECYGIHWGTPQGIPTVATANVTPICWAAAQRIPQSGEVLPSGIRDWYCPSLQLHIDHLRYRIQRNITTIKHTYMGYISISQFDSHKNRDIERWKWRSEALQKLLPTENLLQNPSKKNCNRLLH